MDRRRKLEEELGLLKETVGPDCFVALGEGITLGVHLCRTQYGKPDYHFEFFRRDPLRGRVSNYHSGDLDELIKAIHKTKQWASTRH